MVLFEPPVPTTDAAEAVVTINRWLRLADEVSGCVDRRLVEQPT